MQTGAVGRASILAWGFAGAILQFFWRQSTEDAVYTPRGSVLVSPATSHASFTGSQVSLTFGHVVSRHVSFNADYSHVLVGSALLAVTTRDIDYFGTWTTFTY
jgi:hypothetical protein